MKVRAKFRCYAKVVNPWGNTAVHFHAVYGTEGENADYSKYTPSGNISMNVDNETKATDLFQEGQDYYIDFVPVPELVEA